MTSVDTPTTPADRRTDSPDAAPRDWFRRAFGSVYGLVYRHRDERSAAEEVAALIHWLGFTGAERVIDICCGRGRHMVAFHDAGFSTLGVDLSMPLLQEAAHRPAMRHRLIQADVRSLPVTPSFDVAVNLFSSFGYFEDTENRRALREMVGALRPGGRLVLDHANRPALEAALTPFSRHEDEGTTIDQRRWIAGDRVNKRTTVRLADGTSHGFVESVRLYRPDEMVALVREAGLDCIEQAGGFDGSPLTDRSSRMITTGVKP